MANQTINGIECGEVSKEEIQAQIRAVPNMEAFYSEKFKFIVIMEFDVVDCSYGLYAIIHQNEPSGLFWQNVKSKALFEELAKNQQKIIAYNKAKNKHKYV